MRKIWHQILSRSKIATKVVHLQNVEKEKEKEKQIKSIEDDECWKEYEDSIVCHLCFLYSRGS